MLDCYDKEHREQILHIYLLPQYFKIFSAWTSSGWFATKCTSPTQTSLPLRRVLPPNQLFPSRTDYFFRRVLFQDVLVSGTSWTHEPVRWTKTRRWIRKKTARLMFEVAYRFHNDGLLFKKRKYKNHENRNMSPSWSCTFFHFSYICI